MDECTGPAVALWLRDERGYEVFSVYHEARGVADEYVIAKASKENWVLVTNDKDFGEKVFKERHPHRGVVFLRVEDERPANQIEVLHQLLDNHGDRLVDNFVVVTEEQVRFSSAPSGQQ